MTRQEGSESPQVRQKGPDRIRTWFQHVSQTGPASGVSRTHAHAAHRGESVTDSSASPAYPVVSAGPSMLRSTWGRTSCALRIRR